MREAFGGAGEQVRHVDRARVAVRSHADRGHEVQAQQRQVREVVLGQGLVVQVGVNAAQAAEASGSGPVVVGRRDDDAARVADHDEHDPAGAFDQHPDLAPDLMRQQAEVAGELGRDEDLGRHASPVEVFQATGLVRLEPGAVAEDAFHSERGRGFFHGHNHKTEDPVAEGGSRVHALPRMASGARFSKRV